MTHIWSAFILIFFLVPFRFEILGMHRNVQHRVDYMDWAPGLANFCLSNVLASKYRLFELLLAFKGKKA